MWGNENGDTVFAWENNDSHKGQIGSDTSFDHENYFRNSSCCVEVAAGALCVVILKGRCSVDLFDCDVCLGYVGQVFVVLSTTVYHLRMGKYMKKKLHAFPAMGELLCRCSSKTATTPQSILLKINCKSTAHPQKTARCLYAVRNPSTAPCLFRSTCSLHSGYSSGGPA